MLPARHELACSPLVIVQLQIRPVRPGLRASELPIALQPGLQHFGKRLVLAPAGPILDANSRLEQILPGLLDSVLSHIQRQAAAFVDARSQLTKFRIPAPDRRGARPASQRRIALFQGPLEATPALQVAVFHVKRDPVQVATALVRPARDQVVNVRIDDLQGQRLGQRCRPPVALAIYAHFEPQCAVAHTDAGAAPSVLNLSEKDEFILSMTNQLLCGSAAK